MNLQQALTPHLQVEANTQLLEADPIVAYTGIAGGGLKVAWLASALSSVRAKCPKKVRRRDLMMDESGG